MTEVSGGGKSGTFGRVGQQARSQQQRLHEQRFDREACLHTRRPWLQIFTVNLMKSMLVQTDIHPLSDGVHGCRKAPRHLLISNLLARENGLPCKPRHAA